MRRFIFIVPAIIILNVVAFNVLTGFITEANTFDNILGVVIACVLVYFDFEVLKTIYKFLTKSEEKDEESK